MEQLITTQLREFMAEQEKNKEQKIKDSFWASESEKPLFDIYHQWMGTPPTNPIEAETLMIFSAGKMMELALIANLEKMRLIKKLNGQDHFRIERYGITISGYYDGVFTEGMPLEIKSFYGDYQAKQLKAGNPRTSYLKQLAIYMDALDQEEGRLVYMDRGTGELYEFILFRKGDIFKCMNIEFDINDTYLKWKALHENHILKNKEPSLDVRYKYDIETLDWSKQSKASITAARMGRAVIGDWEVKYSPYKNLIIQREGTALGYSDAELARIKELTRGYSKS